MTVTPNSLSPFPERNTVEGELHSPRYHLGLLPSDPEPPSLSNAIPPSELTDALCPPWVLRIVMRNPELRDALGRAYQDDHRRQYGTQEDQPRAA